MGLGGKDRDPKTLNGQRAEEHTQQYSTAKKVSTEKNYYRVEVSGCCQIA